MGKAFKAARAARASSTTRDTFELIKQAEKYGARVALFGRKIFFAEDAQEIVRSMRLLLEEDVSPEEAVKLYHDKLAKAGIRPKQSLEKDLEVTDPACRLGLGL